MISKARGMVCSIVSTASLGTLALVVRAGMAMSIYPFSHGSSSQAA
ncbi:hypothetical protein [Desulfoplanes formicivorans]|nr:hypothetical protein [Desulfoplanes formicivorans]